MKNNLLTRSQVEDYLIYHVPLIDAKRNNDTPFCVIWDISPSSWAIATQATPWAAYRILATILYKNDYARRQITELYWKS